MSNYLPPSTAADYVYLDKANTLYTNTKAFIAGHRPTELTDIPRPGIPGTMRALNKRVQTMLAHGHFTRAAQLIEKKVRKAHKQEDTP